MSAESWQLVSMVACAGGVYILSVASIVQLLVAHKDQRAGRVKQALLATGLFGLLVIGCLVFLEEIGLLPACLYAALSCASSFALFIALSRRWQTHDQNRVQEIVRLQTDINRLSKSLSDTITPQTLCAQAAEKFSLTRREQDMLLLLCLDHRYTEISEKLYLSPNTVKTHIRALYKKMGASERAKLKQAIDDLL